MCFGWLQYVVLCRFRNTRPITLLDMKFKSKLAQNRLFAKFTGWKFTSSTPQRAARDHVFIYYTGIILLFI